MILTCGTTPVYQRSMTFDRVTLDAVNRAKEVRDYASGKSVNVARVAHTLGKAVLTTGFVGGERGRMLCADLDAARIRHDFVTVSATTRQCVTVIDRSAGTATELVEESPPATGAEWALLEAKLLDLLPRASIWVFSGTLASGGSADFYARWLPLAREHGAQTIVDASKEPLRLAMKHPNVTLKMNRDELAVTLGTDLGDDGPLAGAIRSHTPRGGKLVVTLGARGAVACDGPNCWRAAAPDIQAVSAVGSGDAFAAGLAVAFSDGKPLDEALKLAIACGAANALTPLAGHLDVADVERLQAAVRVERL